MGYWYRRRRYNYRRRRYNYRRRRYNYRRRRTGKMVCTNGKVKKKIVCTSKGGHKVFVYRRRRSKTHKKCRCLGTKSLSLEIKEKCHKVTSRRRRHHHYRRRRRRAAMAMVQEDATPSAAFTLQKLREEQKKYRMQIEELLRANTALKAQL